MLMADKTNPFSEDFQDDETEGLENSTKELSFEKPPVHPGTVTVDAIAEYLLNKQYILTALEFHTEILETGKELPRLRNYFSNPAHFEQQANLRDSNSGSLFRTGSCSTFDSLDLTRYSDDGIQQDDRVAVLEFELRKAKETINSLRTNLTDAVEEDSFLKSPSGGEVSHRFGQKQTNSRAEGDENTQADLKPLEKRAINYLVNEYLLQNDYKLTSITLADENEDQDFEDWDDVGLNMPKPPNLLKLYRDFSSHVTPKHWFNNVGVGTSDYVKDDEITKDTDLLKTMQNECKRLEEENSELSLIIGRLQDESAKQSSIFTSTPSKADERVNGHFQPSDADMEGVEAEENGESSRRRSHSSEKLQKTESSSTLLGSDTKVQDEETELSVMQTLDGVTVQDKDIPDTKKDDVDEDEDIRKPSPDRMSLKFWEALLSFLHETSEENWLLAEISKIASSGDELVSTLSGCLPKIVPTVLLQKREQLIPLLLCTAAMHPSAKERNQLLHDLFNLIKKPDKSQRHMILSGCMAYAKHVGPMQTEEDLLPQCWEQIGHKYAERRHLVAEACGSIAPYLRPEMRSSLLLSILQQMQQEEKLEEVRQAVVRSLAIVFALLHDDDKYNQAFEMLCGFLRDSSLHVRETTRECLLPSFASWAQHRRKLHNHLIDYALTEVESIIPKNHSEKDDTFNPSAFIEHLETIHVLLPHLFAALLRTMPQKYQCATNNSCQGDRNVVHANPLCDPMLMIGNEDEFASLVAAFDACIKKTTFEQWDVLLWCLNYYIPRLLNIVQSINPEHQDCVASLSRLFHEICMHFGQIFVDSKLKEQFKALFLMTGKDMDRQIFNGETALTSAAVAVYSSGILSVYKEDNRKAELSSFLKEMMSTLSSCHASLEGVKAAFIDIRKKDQSFHELLLDILWEGVTHTSAYVRASTASIFVVMATEDVDTNAICKRIIPALITLSADINSAVRTATIPALGAVVECSHISREVVDRVITQMTTFMAPSHCDGEDEPPVPNHAMNVQLVQTMAHVGPKAHPKFRDEFILPHLAAIAVGNNQATNRTKRSDIALELLDAYSNISCCFISDGLLQSAFLPGVRCLLTDMEKLHPEHVAAVNKLIKEKEMKLERGSVTSSGSAGSVVSVPTAGSQETGTQSIDHFAQAVSAGADDAKKKIMATFTQIKARTSQSGTNFFKLKQ